MLDRSGRSRAIALFLILISSVISSCGVKKSHGESFFKKEKIITSHTVISCDGKPDTVIRYTDVSEVENAVKNAYEQKKKAGTNENYTAIRFSRNRSLRIARVPPEEMIKCNFYEIPATQAEKEKAHYFFR